ncbi:MAG: response regulator [Methylococcales bacterium]|nr:response regulator [Methylococcales bacterium]MDD5754232.1 response regulator [Methylococcales bacterium]
MTKILIIDDEKSPRNLLQQILVRDGHEVVTAIDGVDGIDCFVKFDPELVITDMIMPNKNGVELIIELKQLNPDVAIIAMSGGSRTIDADFFLEGAEHLSVQGILQKPFTRDQLREAVQLALKME